MSGKKVCYILPLVALLACKTWDYKYSDKFYVRDKAMLNEIGQLDGEFSRKCRKHIVAKGAYHNGKRVGKGEFNQHDLMIYSFDYEKDQLISSELLGSWPPIQFYNELRDTFQFIQVQRPPFCLGDRHDLAHDLFYDNSICKYLDPIHIREGKYIGTLNFKLLIDETSEIQNSMISVNDKSPQIELLNILESKIKNRVYFPAIFNDRTVKSWLEMAFWIPHCRKS